MLTRNWWRYFTDISYKAVTFSVIVAMRNYRVVFSDGIKNSVDLLWYFCWFDGQVLAVDLSLEQRSHKLSRHIWLLLRSRGATREWDVWTGLTQLPITSAMQEKQSSEMRIMQGWESSQDTKTSVELKFEMFSLIVVGLV